MATQCGIRARLPRPGHPEGGLSPTGGVTDDTQHTAVTLRHPVYPDQSNVLLVLPALDPHKTQEPDHTTRIDFGLHHETSRIACATVANCRWDGFLSEEKAAEARPVTFPHQNLPPTWRASTLTVPASRGNFLPQYSFESAVLERDVSCRITASTLGTEVAHLIPRSEDDWFATNQMFQYSSQPESLAANLTDDTHNAMLLGSNIHSVFNQRCFVVVPKWDVWAVHVLSGLPGEELASVYHNVSPQQLSGLAVEYMFARFAWTVLAQCIFLRAGVPRRLVLVREEDGVPCVSEVSGQECRDISPFQAPKSTLSSAEPSLDYSRKSSTDCDMKLKRDDMRSRNSSTPEDV